MQERSFSSSSDQQSFGTVGRKSTIERAIDKAKAKFGRRSSESEDVSDDDDEFRKQKAKDAEKWKRKEDYVRLGLQ